MKIRLILTLALFTNICYAQTKSETTDNRKANIDTKHQISVYYGLLDNDFIQIEELTGAPDYENEMSFHMGILYQKRLNRKLSFETGVAFFNTDIKTTPAYTGTPNPSRSENLKMIFIPIGLNYDLGKYFFIDGGLSLDLQLNRTSFDKQSGIGFNIGFGGKYNYKHFVFSATIACKAHSLIPFNKDTDYHLFEGGIQLGVGYQI